MLADRGQLNGQGVEFPGMRRELGCHGIVGVTRVDVVELVALAVFVQALRLVQERIGIEQVVLFGRIVGFDRKVGFRF